MKIYYFKFYFVFILFIFFLSLSTSDAQELTLESGFKSPPDSAKIWVYWWWLNGNVDKNSISNDLTEMKKQGFGGALLCDADGSSQDGNVHAPAGPMFGSPEWRELYKHTLKEAAKHGLSISLNIQSGWNLGGPNVKPENATKQIVWSEVIVSNNDNNNNNNEIILPQPPTKQNFYRDIAVIALPIKQLNVSKIDPDKIAKPSASSFQSNSYPPTSAVDGDPATFWVSTGTQPDKGFSKSQPEWFDLTFPKSINATGIVIQPREGYGPKSCELFVAKNDDDKDKDKDKDNFKSIKKFNVDKNNETTIQFDSVAGKKFRLMIYDAFDPSYPNSPRNVQIAEIALLDGQIRLGTAEIKKQRRPLDNLNAKTIVKELNFSAPNCDFLIADEAEVAGEEDAAVEDEVIFIWSENELPESLKEIGEITDPKTGALKFPPLKKSGEWSVMRFGYTCTDARVSTASGKWQGLVIDHLDTDAFDIYWNDNIQPLIDDAGILAGKTLRYVHTDSWELGGLNWTKKMREEFQKRRGYDIVPYLPILAGKILNNRETSNRFLFDLRRTVGDLIAENHYGRMKSKAHEFGIGIHPESGGPHGAPIDSLQLLGINDIPMSEFWSWSPRHRVGDPNRFFTKQPAVAAHTNGKRFVAAEGLTNIGMHWQESFADNLKPAFDQAVCEGCNLLVWHAFTSSPKSEGLPGQEYFAGTHFNPQHTCWNYSADFLAYLNRVQFLTQQGLFAADVIQYYGDNVPNFTQGEWNNVAKSLPDYAYDAATTDVVLKMTTFNGRIFLPDGMNYKVLVLPEVSGINLLSLRKIESLVKDGATIIGSRPKRVLGLTNVQASDAEVKKIADELWGTDSDSDANISVMKIRRVGKGRVVTGMTAAELLRNDKLPPDVQRLQGSLPDGQHRVKWIHRTIHDGKIFGGKFADLHPIKSTLTFETTPQFALDESGNTNRAEIYFVSNLVPKTDKSEIAFRVTKKQPEIWDAVTGTITDAKSFYQENGQTIIPLELPPSGSIFVVFRKPISADSSGTSTDNSIQLETIQMLEKDWNVTFKFKDDVSETIKFPELIDWAKHADERIKYYSGAAIYQKEFLYEKEKQQEQGEQRIYLELDLVREMALIRLNGKELRTLWSRPFRADVTEFVREGKNDLEIEVVNHWANRIIGDAKLPESQRQTKTNIKRLTAQTPLLESGLIGTVQLKRQK